MNVEALRQELKGHGVSGERLELAVRMGAGSLQRAQEVAAGEFDEIRRRVEEFLEAGAAKQDEVYWKILDELGNDRGQLECFLQVCSVYLRDLFLLAYGRSESVVQIDRREYLDNLLERVDAARVALEIDRVVETLGYNVSAQLVLTDLWRILRRGGRAAAFPPDASLVVEGHCSLIDRAVVLLSTSLSIKVWLLRLSVWCSPKKARLSSRSDRAGVH